MKILIVFLLVISVACSNTGCKKDEIVSRSGNPDTPVIPATGNTSPVAYAGEDVFVLMPLNFAKLNGSASDYENNISRVNWSKISGPGSYAFEKQGSLDTKVKNLVKGVYHFELTVTDEMNLVDKDTMVVTVGEISTNPTNPTITPGTNETLFSDLTWIFPWYNNVEIKNFDNYIPRGSLFKVFIQRDYDATWNEVPPFDAYQPSNGLYDYFIITGPHSMYNHGSLYVSYYGFDVDDTPNVKIVY